MPSLILLFLLRDGLEGMVEEISHNAELIHRGPIRELFLLL